MRWLWIVTAASLVGVVANILKRRWCFAVWFVTNTTWAVVDWHAGLRAQSCLFAVYALLAVWGYVAWRRPDRGREGDNITS